jgi:outer membrane protein OmpA-like peptidoglycan-associated protein
VRLHGDDGFRDTWRARGPFGDVEIELHPGSVDAVGREASLRELRPLIYDFKYRQPEARRVVLEVYARLRGLPTSAVRGAAFDFDMGSQRAAAVGEELLFAARAGVLVARRREVRSVVVPLDTPPEEVLGPESTTKHIYNVRVVDDTGAAVAGVALSLDVDGAVESQTTHEAGRVTVEKPAPGTAIVTVTNLDDVREKLWPQWSKPVAHTPPAADQVYSASISQPIAPLRAPSDWHVTLVLTRPPIWRVRMVGMLFDADKCFLLPQALDGIRSIVAMHQAHPAAKVVIVGHEGGDEVTGGLDMALGRAKILAAYLTSKVEDWMPWFDPDKSQRQRWGVREVQLMLSALTGSKGSPFYDGSSAGVMDAKTTDALKAFQLVCGLPVDGKAAASTRKALVTKYMALEDTSLAAGVTPVAHGCTGHEDDTLTQDGLQPDDRRMEVLFFDLDLRPAPSGETSAPGAPEYPAWRMRLAETVDFENHGIHVQIVDTQKQPMPFATAHLDGPKSQETTADEHGFVSFWGLVAGGYTLNATSKTGRPVAPSKITYPTAKTIEEARARPVRGRTALDSPDTSGGSSSTTSAAPPAPMASSEGA